MGGGGRGGGVLDEWPFRGESEETVLCKLFTRIALGRLCCYKKSEKEKRRKQMGRKDEEKKTNANSGTVCTTKNPKRQRWFRS